MRNEDVCTNAWLFIKQKKKKLTTSETNESQKCKFRSFTSLLTLLMMLKIIIIKKARRVTEQNFSFFLFNWMFYGNEQIEVQLEWNVIQWCKGHTIFFILNIIKKTLFSQITIINSVFKFIQTQWRREKAENKWQKDANSLSELNWKKEKKRFAKIISVIRLFLFHKK